MGFNSGLKGLTLLCCRSKGNQTERYYLPLDLKRQDTSKRMLGSYYSGTEERVRDEQNNFSEN
jgi:hypothetical protein